FINNSQLKKQKLIINFEHFVGSDALRLDSVLYQNDLGQQFNVSKLRYYVSNISLKQANGKINTYPGYFLIDESQPTSKSIIINNIVPGTYSALNFIIGVDSIHNCSGVQSGALDPANGMFWAWNTGYIFLKLEGHAALSKSTGQIFEYHIGGYRYPNNCIRSIKLNLGEHCKVDPITNNCNINIKTDIAEIFKTPTAIDVSKLSSVTDFKNAGTIADNYSDMFSILNAK
ncbi:MAG TPA: MbnP family protein, partial [Saprospiraceae bacterium]|nr:MbnP family protein [Saprospiraceae bacterium]